MTTTSTLSNATSATYATASANIVTVWDSSSDDEDGGGVQVVDLVGAQSYSSHSQPVPARHAPPKTTSYSQPPPAAPPTAARCTVKASPPRAPTVIDLMSCSSEGEEDGDDPAPMDSLPIVADLEPSIQCAPLSDDHVATPPPPISRGGRKRVASIDDSVLPLPPPADKQAAAKLEKARLSAERAAEKKRVRDAEKAEKAAVAEQRRAMQTANKVITDKRTIVFEIAITVDTRFFDGSSDGADPHGMGDDIMQKMAEHSVKLTVAQMPHPYTATWHRCVAKEWDPAILGFRPLDAPRTYDERFAVYAPPIGDLLALIAGTNRLPLKLAELRSLFPGKKLLLLLSGIDDYFRRRRAATDRAFKRQVRDIFTEASGGEVLSQPAPAKSRKSKSAEANSSQLVDVSRDTLDQAILWLECQGGCLVMPMARTESVSDWLVLYSREVAMSPYEQGRVVACETFASSENTGRSGRDQMDTYQLMLLVVGRVTATIATTIARAYPTLGSLLTAFHSADPAAAPLLLSDLAVPSGTGGGSAANRRVGPALSKRIWTLFTSRDAAMRPY